MNMLFVLNIGFDRPGPSVHLFEDIFIQALRKGHKVRIILKTTGGVSPEMPDVLKCHPNLTYHVISEKEPLKNNFVIRYLIEIRYAFRCCKIYKSQEDTDVVFLQSCANAIFPVCLLCRRLKKPVVFNVQDIFPENAARIGIFSKNAPLFRIFSRLQRKAYAKCAKIITISEDMKKTLASSGVPEQKIAVIPNWGDTERTLQIPRDENEFIRHYLRFRDTSGFHVVYAGNIGRMQNVDIVLKAAQKLRDHSDIRFWIVGNGVYREKLRRYAQTLSLENLVFLDPVPAQYAIHLYAFSDINLIPLAKGVIHTATPSKTANCAACMKPAIAAVGFDSHYANFYREHFGWKITDSDDADGLAQAILEIKHSGHRPSEDAARIFHETFSPSKNSMRYVQTLESAARAAMVT
ncbi:MAG TPA: glycosyltransferase family 4 protein [Oscillospiraceae bacterium]|nr:glycosyltransferase family 4 protein [Oscillospiraceae bacterium]HPF54931.1 glycosyltransferase family 4 protein [Clostridiales bacterium]HPK34990.1 glycosyltransferase family 4 protein [Oscillospiraceae bacterium]HPR75548.1 glycosyltransferase family 4 protein [Oscillospiraceae bacterium]